MDDSDLEVNEARFDWLHTNGNNIRTDFTKAEIEKGFGVVTLELEVPYERDTSLGVDPLTGRGARTTVQGMSNVNLGARSPIYQFVSANGLIDTTYGGAVEVGIPTNSPVSKNSEVVPKVFAAVKIGDHFTVQSVLGHSRSMAAAAWAASTRSNTESSLAMRSRIASWRCPRSRPSFPSSNSAGRAS